MASQCEKIKKEYEELKTLKQEFDLEYEKAVETGKLDKAKELKKELEQKRDALTEKLWPFEGLSQEKFRNDYEKTIDGYREFGWLKILSSGKEGIIDEKGNEYPIPSIQEIKKKLMEKREFYAEKFATMENPRVHLTPFALNPESMKDDYGRQIENHFVEERIEGDKRIPDKNKTKLFGADGKPLPLRTDKQNVRLDDSLKGLKYFPEWKEEDGSIKAKGGITKEEAAAQIGGWLISIIEDIPKAPEAGEGKPVNKKIKIKGKIKKVKRTPVEGGKNAVEQYQLLKKQNEEGFTPEDWISFATLYLKENNIVLDDDKRTDYYCRLLGANTVFGYVRIAYWGRDNRRVGLSGDDPRSRGGYCGVRGRVRVF